MEDEFNTPGSYNETEEVEFINSGEEIDVQPDRPRKMSHKIAGNEILFTNSLHTLWWPLRQSAMFILKENNRNYPLISAFSSFPVQPNLSSVRQRRFHEFAHRTTSYGFESKMSQW
jgi:hypothetical protein